MERVEFPPLIQESAKQLVLLAGIAVRLAVCPGDDIAMVSGSLAAGTGRETQTHEAIMPTQFELDLSDRRKGRLPKNLR